MNKANQTDKHKTDKRKHTNTTSKHDKHAEQYKL